MDNTFVEAISDLSRKASLPDTVNGVCIIRTGDGYEVVDTEKYEASPRRKRGKATFRDRDSFAAYITRHSDSKSVIFVDPEAHTFECIFDHHEAGELDPSEAGWGEHRALLELRFTPSWTAWQSLNGWWIGQQDFAEFLELRIPDINHPDGAALLEIVRTLRIKLETNWSNTVVLQNNTVQMTWTEDMTTGNVVVPEDFTLVMRPFDGGDNEVLTAKLRFTKPDAQGKVKFKFDLGENLRAVLDAAVDKIAASLDETGVPVFKGRWA